MAGGTWTTYMKYIITFNYILCDFLIKLFTACISLFEEAMTINYGTVC